MTMPTSLKKLIYRTSLLTVSMGFCANGFGEDGYTDGISYSIPTTSRMLARVVKKEYIVFEGTADLRARYEFIYQQTSGNRNNPTLHLYPVHDPSNNIPGFKDRGRPVKHLQININNPKSAANMLFGKVKTARLFNGEYPVYAGEAYFMLEGLSATYKCNAPVFVSDVIGVGDTVQPVKIGPAKQRPGC